MKITIFTISDCYFSKQEKEYLQAHNLPFEEKNLEENREFLTEMLTISNNFAGTPVTKIEKDDGQIVVLKGFTKEEFDKTFNFTDAAVAQQAPPQITMSEPTVTQNSVIAPSTPTVDLGSIAAQIEQLKKLQESLAAQTKAPAPSAVAPVVAPPVPAYQPPAPQPVVQAVAPPVAAPQPVQAPAPAPVAQPAANVDDSLAAILAELQTKINSSQPGAPTNPPTTN